MLEDLSAITIEDEHPNEKRFITLGTDSLGRLLVVVYVTIRLDTDILNWFRHQVEEQGGGNYQTMINQALREYILY